MIGRRRSTVCVLAALVVALTAGCGSGGGAGSPLTTTAGRAALDVYVTDGFTDQYKMVLATLFKIELTTDGATYQTVFSSAAGQTLDLASLASTSELLASVSVPTGNYTQARITFGDHITLVSNSGTSTSVAVDPSSGTGSNGQAVVTVSTPTAVAANQTNSVFVDFKLAEFQLAGNLLRPSIHCGNGDPGMLNRERSARLAGTISGLTATGFTLQGEHGRTVTVTVSDATILTSGQTGAVTTLANGQNVIVKGAFDRTTQTLNATYVTLNDYTTVRHAGASGTVTSVDVSAGSFVLTVSRAEGITPTGATITVITNANTHFGKGRHHQGALADVTVGTKVEANGVFDTTTQTLTAKSVGLHTQ